MPFENTKILEFNQYQKSDKVPFLIYADLECIIGHIPSGLSMPTISSFTSIENKHDVCRYKDCMKKFCELLREHAMKIIKFKKKEMKLLTKQQQESYENVKINI